MQLVYSEPEEPYPVWADPARLRQVFVNLFDNAIKYSEPSGTIFLELSRTPVTVTASIRDQGRGIAADDLEKVKQKFFKAKNSVRGSGIGLAVVDEIVQTLGGRFDIDSTLGQGTTVTVTLPIYHPGQEHLHEKI
jgi:signal transduction histidine kinase